MRPIPRTSQLLATSLSACFLAFAACADDSRDKPGAAPQPPAAAKKTVTAETAASPLEFTMKDIDGKEVELSRYKGQVVLLVNTASECGMTPQYKQLQEVYTKYKDQGLRICAFPANNFGGQEPGDNPEIKAFCTSEYGVTFDLFAKVSVKGDDCCELYKYLTSKEKLGDHGGPIPWNFTKFVIGRDGKVLQRFGPRTKPDDDAVIKLIEKALAEK